MAKRPTGSQAMTSQQSVAARAKTVEIMDLKIKGYSFTEIAEKLGYKSRSSPFKQVKRELERISKKCSIQAEELRTLESAKLDKLETEAWKLIESGNPRGIDQVKSISESRRKLFGLDAPIKQEITGEINVGDLRARLAARLSALADTPEDDGVPLLTE